MSPNFCNSPSRNAVSSSTNGFHEAFETMSRRTFLAFLATRAAERASAARVTFHTLSVRDKVSSIWRLTCPFNIDLNHVPTEFVSCSEVHRDNDCLVSGIYIFLVMLISASRIVVDILEKPGSCCCRIVFEESLISVWKIGGTNVGTLQFLAYLSLKLYNLRLWKGKFYVTPISSHWSCTACKSSPSIFNIHCFQHRWCHHNVLYSTPKLWVLSYFLTKYKIEMRAKIIEPATGVKNPGP